MLKIKVFLLSDIFSGYINQQCLSIKLLSLFASWKCISFNFGWCPKWIWVLTELNDRKGEGGDEQVLDKVLFSSILLISILMTVSHNIACINALATCKDNWSLNICWDQNCLSVDFLNRVKYQVINQLISQKLISVYRSWN